MQNKLCVTCSYIEVSSFELVFRVKKQKRIMSIYVHLHPTFRFGFNKQNYFSPNNLLMAWDNSSEPNGLVITPLNPYFL